MTVPTDFKKLLLARFLFTFAVQMQAVILGWRIYDLWKSPLSLGLIGLTEAIPAISLALYAGYLVDRSRPLLIYRRVIYVSFLSGLFVLTEHIFESSLSLKWQSMLLYAAAFLTGTARSFAHPAIFSSIPRIVERGQLVRAAAMMSSAMQVARIAGPAFGGIIFGFIGATPASAIVCLVLLGSVLSIWSIKKALPAPAHKANISIKAELFSGAAFVFRHPILFPAMTLDMVSVFFGGVTALLPIFAGEILMIGPKGLGALRAAPAVGAALMGFYLSKRVLVSSSGRWLLFAVAGYGCSILLFGYSQYFFLSFFALFASGMFDSISMVVRSSAVQLASPDDMRGKISAVNSMFVGSSNEIGEFESGVAAKLLGPMGAVFFGGFACLATVACIAYFFPALRRLDLSEWEKSPT